MKFISVYLPALLFVGVMVAVVVWPEPFAVGQRYIEGMGRYSYVVFVLVLASGVVFAPLFVMPIIPLGTTIFGPFVTGVLSVLGWTLGATIAFLIARYIGRPFLEQWLAMDRLDEFIDRFKPAAQFWLIVLMRNCIPVDVLSYTLGVSKTLKFSTYFFATLVGVTYFAFAFAYIGDAFFSGNTFVLMEVGLISLAIFLIGWYLLKRSKAKHFDKK